MEELYKVIEEKIAASGYPGKINGREFYYEVSAESESKENGTYLFVIKKDEFLSYHGCMDIKDDEFDLHYVDIVIGEKTFHVDFDA